MGNLLLRRREILKTQPAPATFTGLCFTAVQANSRVKLEKSGSPAWSGSYSTDGATWEECVPGSTEYITLANVGDKCYFKGDISANFSYSTYIYFSMGGKIACSGNCNSMYVSEGFEDLHSLTYECCYYSMFKYCPLTTAPELPATALSRYCYSNMFAYCRSLETPPSLPATTLNAYCYDSMFRGCTSLTTVPELPATTTEETCYGVMFNGCTSLYVSDSQGTGHDKVWTIPTTGSFSNSRRLYNTFTNCLGTRSTDDMLALAGQVKTYYTQNTPV